jgi:pyruvate ferredoxin oxidoreductase gamma subunit
LGFRHSIGTVNATMIAQEELGVPITNTTMLGSLLKARRIVDPESLFEPLKKRFRRVVERNIRAFQRAYKETEVIPKV